MTAQPLAGTTAVVTGASRGFGRSIAAALHTAGATVVGVARHPFTADRVEPVVADVTDPVVAGTLLDRYRPRTLVLNAGAAPLMRPVQHHTWESFSRNWEVDVRHAFGWIREALLLPLPPGSTVIAVSSAALLRGSPMSGGYAGAKAAVRDLAEYAADESERAGLGIRFVSVLPKLTPATDLGGAAAAAYARRSGIDLDTYLDKLGPALEPDVAGREITRLATSGDARGAHLLTADGLSPLTRPA